ncbi:hypothetical protein IWX65_003123 [Arthrobacter sp. CAN_A214]|uniref:hypothetical protein n=1 Tax=Arthrobacter sp. CAN_A214 TaxID=2787720 RepID=UPI0018C9E01F
MDIPGLAAYWLVHGLLYPTVHNRRHLPGVPAYYLRSGYFYPAAGNNESLAGLPSIADGRRLT